MLACFLDVGTQFTSMYQFLNVTHVHWRGEKVWEGKTKSHGWKHSEFRPEGTVLRVGGQGDALLSAWFSQAEKERDFFSTVENCHDKAG